MQRTKRKRYQKDTAPTDDIVTLIHLVRQNPALYNYKMQPNQRRRVDVLNGWAQIAAQIGNKYSVEECRRKWKNLRDTYHQYRLRKPKVGEGLSKWRYSKELDFLSNVYQPKLKINRINQNYDITKLRLRDVHEVITQDGEHEVNGDDEHEQKQHDVNSNDIVDQTGMTLVDEDAGTFILSYESNVNGDVVTTINHRTHDDSTTNIAHMELGHHSDDVEEIVKNEHHSPLDGGATIGEVDYEEVCLYEEADNTPTVDCETIITTGSASVALTRNNNKSTTKSFQYLEANDFCIQTINTSAQNQLNNNSTAINAIGSSGIGLKIKPLSMVSCTSSNSSSFNMNTTTNTATATVNNCNSLLKMSNSPIAVSTSSPSMSLLKTTQIESPQIFPAPLPIATVGFGQVREELDLFFDFLKKKIQRFPKAEITAIQVEFLNCVLRREADHAQKQEQYTS